MTYKQSRRGNAAIDRIVAHVLRHDEVPHRISPSSPMGMTSGNIVRLASTCRSAA